ncbi:hypothetical protein FT663_00685 [Candidozyma haemuli var. vulneris]|uniref:Vacuolar ATPase assembly protein VMA22 n=1 Tax=Candidozyma haemuli TaxID=45357 RepID=A0A2V1APT0_9ASCO|nr:hypothetical protein CXQ85_003716 [[Candida] haemuloni]KAF3987523.1 hypothetical protein FT662_03956 [[Candida] haemuloni var. vulneris]KAF3995142.1 hypothetical protein FT663_00685 [[Candida] haemuloni var. vulneris]PVH19858.1 hypothetical protein CXQ85_003716 [[Candida] haemuloni]
MTDLSDQDEAVIKLLDLLDQYEKLANDQFRVNFITGMQNLSRANFNSENKKYGTDSLDRRPYEACKVVEGSAVFVLKDKLKEAKKDAIEEKESEKPEESTLRSRGNKTKPEKVSTTETVKEPSKSLRDPIYQFGVLVPYQLRNAQASFNESLADIISMVNLRQQITDLVAQIEKAENTP